MRTGRGGNMTESYSPTLKLNLKCPLSDPAGLLTHHLTAQFSAPHSMEPQ